MTYESKTTIIGDGFVGSTLASVDVQRGHGNDSITFRATDGRTWVMKHYQDCCEVVDIDDICGNIDDLVGAPILAAEESWKESVEQGDCPETWTFYRITTFKGTVVIRWRGSSNGYYSERVSFYLDA